MMVQAIGTYDGVEQRTMGDRASLYNVPSAAVLCKSGFFSLRSS